MTFYFTYGLGDPKETGQDYQGGWTEVEAEDLWKAVDIYKIFHPCTNNLLPCSGVALMEGQMGKMLATGNGGKFCHDRITVTREVME
jgi:hypothetical protein